MTYTPGPYGYGYPPVPPPPKPGVIPLAPLGLGDLLSGAFGTYGRYWKALLGVTVAAYALTAALVAGVALLGWATLADRFEQLVNTPSSQAPEPSDLMPFFLALGGVWLAGMIGFLLATGLLHGAVAAVVQEAVLGRPAGFLTVWRRAWSRLGAVLGAIVLPALAPLVPMLGFLIGFFFLLGGIFTNVAAGRNATDEGAGLALTALLLFLLALGTVPFALWIWVKFSLAPTAAVIESAGPLASLRRSSELVRGSWWRVFGCMLVMMLIAGGAAFVVQTVLSLAGQASMVTVDVGPDATPRTVLAELGGLTLVLGLLQLLTQALIAPLQPLISGLLYVDQRIRRENLAPVLAQAAGLPPA
ncbi:oxidoreductase [Streptomyces sp. CC208A]|uniref:oxidoreductase n=1 Tax=Streptomyces sp. CC208A TaxID=3044573 RepID=UPI0024A7C2ED|nr:oxidoreductase [Streptomyces sp. CC208A]